MSLISGNYQINSRQHAETRALCDQYVYESSLELVDLITMTGEIFGCDERNLSTVAEQALAWIQACHEAHRDQNPLPPFPQEFIVVGGKQPSGSGPGPLPGSNSKGGRAEKSKQAEPKAAFNPSSQPVPGTEHSFGDCATHAILECDMSFMGDVDEIGPGKLQVRAATNFCFVDRDGEHVSVGHGPVGTNPVYLIAACGSLNPLTEGGQRLAAGWWNSDPDPTLAEWKAPAEIVWLKILVQYVYVDSGLKLRNEKTNLIMADGEQGSYVLQCPDPTYANRWSFCFTNFQDAKKFQGVTPEGQCPEWFDPVFWRDLRDEYRRWRQAKFDINPPARPEMGKDERLLLRLQADVAHHEAVVRNSKKGVKWCENRLNELRTPAAKRKKTNRPPTIHDENVRRERVVVTRKQHVFTQEGEKSSQELKALKPKLAGAQRKYKAPAPAQPTHVPQPPPEESDMEESDDDEQPGGNNPAEAPGASAETHHDNPGAQVAHSLDMFGGVDAI
ncbi:hypothetical protein BDV93DRAFT_515843 [Ceratobasidium sp. AG-I]|nr:hypothetical protein BDV93DRAFT_515843 [Ceratobasidium sp. AG-I]